MAYRIEGRRTDQPGTAYRLAPPNVVLFGPPGSGKSVAGRALADRLQRPFADTDEIVQERAGKSIPSMFAEDGEATFRRIEAEVCREFAARAGWVVACGGGALINEETRRQFELSSLIVCLQCDPAVLRDRLRGDETRPLLHGDPTVKLEELLDSRRAAYDSISLQLDTTRLSLTQVVEHLTRLIADEAKVYFHVRQGKGYEIHLGPGLLSSLNELIARAELGPPYVTVADSNVAPLYGRSTSTALGGSLIEVPAGEQAKTLETVRSLYEGFIAADLERKGTVIAVGGGVVTDMAGFAAATFMRGVSWVAVPTSLLGMVDASVGGKVGVDLEQGKNLVGAFYPPALIVADTNTLETLPETEMRAGLSEVLKAAMIGDARLFELMERAEGMPNISWITPALAVKIRIVEADPLEAGERAVLNFGHTIGHGLEVASSYRLTHGEAVSIGMVAETMLSERIELADSGLARRLAKVVRKLGLPSSYSGVTPEMVRRSMQRDKKRSGGALLFSLPVAPGQVRRGIQVAEPDLMKVLKEVCRTP